MKTDSFFDNYINKVYGYLQKIVPITPEQFMIIKPFLELRSFDKKTVVLQKGELENYLSIVVQGLVRKFIKTGRRESTIQIASEGHLIQAEISFHERIPSLVHIETIEPSYLVSIHFENIQKLLAENEFAEDLAIAILYFMFIIKDKRTHNQLKKNTRERFLEYVNHHPHMLQRVPQKILASYLNIEPETFSRLKHLV